MSQPSERDVLDALRPIQDPDFKRSIVDLGFVKNLRIDGGKVVVRDRAHHARVPGEGALPARRRAQRSRSSRA